MSTQSAVRRRLLETALGVAAAVLVATAGMPQPARAALAVIAVPDVLSTNHDRFAVVAAPGVLGNDVNVLGSTTAILISGVSHGVLNLQPDGGYTYAPVAGFTGTDLFRYRPSGLLSTSTTVTISVTNAAPVAMADSYTATAGVALHVNAPGVLVNDLDLDGDALMASLTAVPNHGTLAIGSNGSFTYTANGGYSGIDTFTYRAGDGLSWSAITPVTLVVQAAAPTPSPTPTPRPTPTPTPRPTPRPTPTPTPTPTPLATVPLPTSPVSPTPTPSLPLPSVVVPTPSTSSSPLPSASVPLLVTPTPSPSSGGSSGSDAPASPAAGPPGGGSTGGDNQGGAAAASADGAPGARTPLVIGPNGLGLRSTPLGAEDLPLAGLRAVGSLQLWLVPAAALAGPGILVILWLAIQVGVGIIWLPAARRMRGDGRRNADGRKAGGRLT
jgi:outer membrane biosynthesis protein TonB